MRRRMKRIKASYLSMESEVIVIFLDFGMIKFWYVIVVLALIVLPSWVSAYPIEQVYLLLPVTFFYRAQVTIPLFESI